ncbi:hypothetical protein [Burkholderia sp. Ed8]|uniref:hypothetical protein n=1 Tax=Burkholderia sp. Ed8 TaxID=3112957 RepID=UPI00345CCE4A
MDDFPTSFFSNQAADVAGIVLCRAPSATEIESPGKINQDCDATSTSAIEDDVWNLAEIYPARFEEWFDCFWSGPRELVLLSLGIDPKSAIAAAELVCMAGEVPCYGVHEEEYQRRIEAVRHAMRGGWLANESLGGNMPIRVTAFLRWAEASSWGMPQGLYELSRHQARVERQSRGAGYGQQTGPRAETQQKHQLFSEIALQVASETPNLSRAELARRVARRARARLSQSVSDSTVRNVLFNNGEAPLRGAAWQTFQAKAREVRRNRVFGRNAL